MKYHSPPFKMFYSACRRTTYLLVSAAAVLLILAPHSPITAQVYPVSDVVISQVYTRGGEPGAAYQNDFIDLFNRTDNLIDISGYSIVVVGLEGAPTQTAVFTLSTGSTVLFIRARIGC